MCEGPRQKELLGPNMQVVLGPQKLTVFILLEIYSEQLRGSICILLKLVLFVETRTGAEFDNTTVTVTI